MIKIEKVFSINSWENWYEIVPASVDAFFNEYDLYPNYLKANHVVFDKLLQRCIADGIENCDTLKQDEPLELGGYISHQWALQYTPDDLIPEFQFLLVYDPSINI